MIGGVYCGSEASRVISARSPSGQASQPRASFWPMANSARSGSGMKNSTFSAPGGRMATAGAPVPVTSPSSKNTLSTSPVTGASTSLSSSSERARSASARAEAERARSELDERLVLAPVTGLVDKVFFDEGEVTGTGAPAVAILPPGALKVLFFIPEPERAEFAIGQKLALGCDACPEGLRAEITRLASDPQYTPPIIYSRDERARLVFRAEGRLLGEAPLLPGQPVTLRRLP